MASRYQTIVADPPWEYHDGFTTQSRSAGKWKGDDRRYYLNYETMSVDAIAALPVRDLADDDCRLFLWTTNRHLPSAFSIVRDWGFWYRQALVWHKLDGNMGGSVAPCSAEFLIVATLGHPAVLSKWDTAVIRHATAKQHSRKPDVFLDLAEAVSPAPRLELFARRQRLGWDTWGNEALQHVELSA